MKRILFGCLILWMAYGQFTSIPCPGNSDLQDLIQMTQEFEIMSSTAADEQTFTTPFAATYFDHAPSSYSTIHYFEGQSFDQIHFRLSSRILPGNLEVKFQSEHMEWKIVKVTTWISGRQDIVMQIASSVSESIVEPRLLHFNNTKIANFYTSDVVVLNFLTGLSAKSSNDTYGVSLQKNSAQIEAYEVTITPSNGTVVDYIEFLYVIFNPKISFFSSGGTELEYTNLKAPQYHRVHKTFAPIKYAYFGLYKLFLNKNQLFLSMSLDQDYILSVSSQTGILQIGASILTIGRTPKQVCSQCLQKFVWQDSCVSDCGGNSYPYSNYTDGGQACLTCSSKMLEQLKDDGTGCTCAEGTQYSPVLSQCLLCEAPQVFHQRLFVCSKCGNGVLDEGEACDDGNFNPQDGCSPSCHSQNGYLCMSKNCTKMLNLEKTKTLSNGIYTQFSTAMPSSELTKEFKATYLNNTPRPERTKVITQDPNKVKIICEYCLMPPTKVQIDYQLFTKSGEVVHYRLSYKGRGYKQIEE